MIASSAGTNILQEALAPPGEQSYDVYCILADLMMQCVVLALHAAVSEVGELVGERVSRECVGKCVAHVGEHVCKPDGKHVLGCVAECIVPKQPSSQAE